MDLWFRTWNTVQYFSLLESKLFLIIEVKWLFFGFCFSLLTDIFPWVMTGESQMHIFPNEMWSRSARGVRWERLVPGWQQCHGTIIRMIHIYLAWELELKGVCLKGRNVRLLARPGECRPGVCLISVMLSVLTQWGCTLWALKLSGFYGASTFKVMC